MKDLNSEALEITRGEKPGHRPPKFLIEVLDSLIASDLALFIHFDPKEMMTVNNVRQESGLKKGSEDSTLVVWVFKE